jgi:isopropylmalate/isohomocitrate dehydrogenase-like protein
MMSKTYHIVISPGDGCGHEIIGWAQKTLETVSTLSGDFGFDFIPIEIGVGAFKKTGEALSKASLDAMRSADATLFVAIAAAEIPRHVPNPITVMRKELDLYANIRPLKDYPRFAPKGRKTDLIVLRENTEGFYSGIEYWVGQDAACAVRVITRRCSERIARVGLNLARERRKRVTVIHKVVAHKLTDGLFIDVVEQIGKTEFPEIEVERMMIDAAAVHLIKDPMRFDVILATNAYGDILSDEAAEITGGIGLAPSANIGDGIAVFEPAHGTAPGRTGKRIANPIATLLAAKLMLEYLGEKEAGHWIQTAADRIIEKGEVLTPDMGGKNTTDEVGEAIIGEILVQKGH